MTNEQTDISLQEWLEEQIARECAAQEQATHQGAQAHGPQWNYYQGRIEAYHRVLIQLGVPGHE